MKRNLLILLLLLATAVQAQLTINNTARTPAQLVQDVLVGAGVTPTNIKFNGSPISANQIRNQAGEFMVNFNGSTLGLDRGLILATGDAQYALGPNNCMNLGCGNILSAQAYGTDPDLVALSHNTIFNSCILEFDFVATGLELNFDFVFASEEYPDYVGSLATSINDSFGFFLSGPGIFGPYSGGIAKNIARLPNTSTEISIATVNNGHNNDGNNVDGPGPAPNAAYYFNNSNIGLNPNTSSLPTVQYDGFTKVIRATSPLQCGGTYHIKLAVGNVSDPLLDSAVFLKNFTIPPLQLQDDSFSTAPVVCFGKTITITSGITVGANRVEWYKGGVLIIGENGPDLVVNSAGTYMMKVYTPGGCLIAMDDIVVTYRPEIILNTPVNKSNCSSVANAQTFNIDQTVAILGSLNPSDYIITYYNTNAGNEASNGSAVGIIPDADLSAYTITGNTATIWVRVEDFFTNCASVKSFTLNVIPLASGTISYDLSPYCEGLTSTQSVTEHSLTPGGTYSAFPAGLNINTANGAITPFGSTVGVYTVTYEIPASATCSLFTTTAQVEIKTCPCTVIASSTNEAVCVNTPIPSMTYTIAGGAINASISSGALPTGVAGSLSGGIYTLSGTPTIPGVYNFSVTVDSGVDVCTQAVIITVRPNTAISLISLAGTDNQTVCINASTLDAIRYSIYDGGLGASVSPLPNGITGAFTPGTPGTFTISGTPTVSGSFPYTVTTSGGCLTASLSGVITVSPNATISLSSATATDNQSICNNSPLTAITYTVADGATGAAVTTLPAGLSGGFSGNTFTISGTPTVSGIFPYTVTTSGGCGTASLSGTITVNLNAAIGLNSGLASDNQSICVNSPLTSITYTVANGATGASVTTLPAGLIGSFSGNTFTISGTPTVVGSFPYTVTTTGGCYFASLSGTITVNPNATISLTSTALSTSQSLCTNTALTAITYDVAAGATGATVTPLPAGVSGSFAGNTFTISGSPTTAGVYPYTVSTTGGCGTASLSGTITVNVGASISLSSAAGTDNQSVCINTPLTSITYPVADGATGASVTPLPAGITGGFAGGVFTISGTPTIAGTFPYTVSTIGGCGTATLSGTITVNPNVTLALTSGVGSTNQLLCINTAMTTAITYALGNVDAIGATVTNLPPGVNASYAAGVLTISGTPTLAGSYSYTVTTSGGCSTASQGGIINVDPNATISMSSASGTDSQSICINTPLTAITYPVADGATGASVTTLPAGITGSFAGGVFTISGTPTIAGSFPYTVTTSGGCSNASLSGTITVNPNVTLALTSGVGSTNQLLCINTPMTTAITYALGNVDAIGATVTNLPPGVNASYAAGVLTISGTPTLAGSYSYTVTTSGGCSTASQGGIINVAPNATISMSSASGTDNQSICINTPLTAITYPVADGATGASVTTLPAGLTGSFAGGVFTISGTPTIAGSFPYTVTTSGGCSSASLSGSITVNPAVTLTLTSGAGSTTQSLCVNLPIAPITYNLQNVDAIGATVSGLPPGVTTSYASGAFTISGTPTLAGTYPYTVTTSGGCGTASLSGTITINPDATITLNSAPASTSQTLCINTAITPITYIITNAAGVTINGLPAGVSGSFAAGVYTISGTPTVTGTFSYTLTALGGCSTASTGSITVNPAVVLNLTSGAASTSQTVCVGTPITSITYSISNAGATGATITTLPSGLTASYAAGVFTISGTPTASGTFPYTITTSGGCSSASLTGTITVNPNATISLGSLPATSNQSVCINTSITPIIYTIGNGATNASISTGGLPTGVTAVFSAGVLTISGNALSAGTFNYEVSTSGGCAVASLSGVIVVNPNVALTLNSVPSTTLQTTCINKPIIPIKYNLLNGATGATVTGLPAGITGSYAGGVFTISGSTATVNSFAYVVTTTGGCGTASLNGTITVNPDVTIALSSAASTSAQYLCLNETITPITYLVGNGATGASLVAGTVPVGISGSYNPINKTFTISGTVSQTGPFNYTIATTGGCNVASLSGSIFVNPLPVVNLQQDGFICVDVAGMPNTTYTLDTQLNPGLYSFEWMSTSGVISGATGPFYIATSPGVYSVKVTNTGTGCVETAQAMIVPSLPPSQVFASATSYFEEDQMVTVNVLPLGDYEYQLDNGMFQSQNYFVGVTSGEHTITVKDKYGCGVQKAQVKIVNFPKFFTPNGDGYNDTWNISEISDQPNAKIYIFDRFGKLIKEISPGGTGWDGTFNQINVPADDYWFIIQYQENLVSKEFKSHFSLKR